ncbi:hypothetical protein LX36DRAFT_701194 [Colletotrichum falcatum]|nr:hypothetical protein LX36DRAFT_701194 [Colletotrichum falcatum]
MSQAPQTSSRRRQPHIRSRTGCGACKKKHVRCDEKRPICTKCLTTGTSCDYPPLERWINEVGVSSGSRPNFVGRGGWNAVWQLPRDPRTVDPFDSMPLRMSSKSHELFRYFVNIYSLKDGTASKSIQIIGKVADSPNSFHGILLLAGLHYYWNNGHLGGFSSTYYAHKVNLIRSINAYLEEADHNDLGKFRTYMNIVGTIALIEMSMGDYDAARAHLIGLSTLKDRFKSLQKGRLTAANAANASSEVANSTDDPVQLYLALLTYDVIEALWLVTYFLMASYDISSKSFNISDLLDYLRLVTTAHGGCYPSPSLPFLSTTEWQTNTPNTRQASPYNTTMPWGSTLAAGGAYIHCIIGLPWTYGPSARGGPLCYMLPAIQQDVAVTEAANAGSRFNIDDSTEGARLGHALWLWKIIVGACTILSAQKAGIPAPEPGGPGGETYHQEVVPRGSSNSSLLCDDDDELYGMLMEWWARRLRRWSRVTEIVEWNAVRT